MKITKINKWAALLLTASSMAALPLSAYAINKTVTTGQNIVESGSSYDNGGSNHVLSVNGGTYSGTGITLTSTVAGRNAAYTYNQGSVSLYHSIINTTEANDAFTAITTVTGYLENVNITASGSGGTGVIANVGGNITIVGGTVTAYRNALVSAAGSAIQADHVTMVITGTQSSALYATGTSSINLNAVSIDARNIPATGYAVGSFVSSTISGTNVKLITAAIGLAASGNSLIELTGGSLETTSTGGLIVVDGGNVIINGGTLTASNGSLLQIETAFTGTDNVVINNADTANAGGIVMTGSGSDHESNVTISGGNGIHGGVTNSSDGNLNLNLNDSSLTGNVTGSNSGTTTITVTGPGGSLIGDIDQKDNSNITINISGGASGTGGFIDGGNLNVIGGDSSWTFDKDSHGNNGTNEGKWIVGDNTVIFDNMNNNGKIVIDVDSDDLTHGTFDVTGTASGTGKITVNVTGSTKASQEGQDRIINDLVQGNGKGAWEFDPIEWGLIKEEVIVGPDGNLYVRNDGKLSTAGNIAVGLLVAQKGAWFAQQNSLLKRMGEIRLAADTQRQLIGKDDKSVTLSADKLIENVWIRAYGQQLNYGASVTGQAFRQYVYGTDIGTDHKWTLDQNNALYTGIFAGYGAADTDHRHHGSKSEIHNYYFGLYASWLNVDGWYLDATIKAQYSDNSLDGYANGVDYFNGSYNNWSVGGSLEFGKQFKFEHDWFIEPQLQANYLHLLASDYTMSQGLNVNTSDLDAFQLRAGIVAGRTLKLKNGGALQPYVKVSGVEMVSTGGKLNAMGNTVRPNLDGARAELGAGIIWQLDAHNQLHLDYEASFGDKYDKPWGLTAGYRYQF